MSVDMKMAWRNIWRNPRRTILTISAIVFACILLVFMLSFQFGSYEAMINSSVTIHAGHLQVQAKGYNEKRTLRLAVPNPQAIGNILDQIREIKAYTFRAETFSLVSSRKRTYGVAVIGIDPVREARVSTLKKSVKQGRYFSPDDENKTLVGELLASNLKVGAGDELTILGQGRDGSIAATIVIVKGIVRSGLDELDRSSLYIPLKTFQDVYSMEGGVTQVVAICETLREVSCAKRKVQNAIARLGNSTPLVVLDWQELVPGLKQGIEIDLVSGIIFYFILILVVAFSILNTFLMAIFERTREFGVLMAIGTSPERLTWLLLIESTSMTVMGIAIGVFLGSMISLYFQAHGIDISGSSEILAQFGISGRIYPRLSLLSALSGPCVVLIITFLSALYPALKIKRLRPVEAMTYV